MSDELTVLAQELRFGDILELCGYSSYPVRQSADQVVLAYLIGPGKRGATVREISDATCFGREYVKVALDRLCHYSAAKRHGIFTRKYKPTLMGKPTGVGMPEAFQ